MDEKEIWDYLHELDTTSKLQEKRIDGIENLTSKIDKLTESNFSLTKSIELIALQMQNNEEKVNNKIDGVQKVVEELKEEITSSVVNISNRVKAIETKNYNRFTKFVCMLSENAQKTFVVAIVGAGGFLLWQLFLILFDLLKTR